MGLLGCAFHPKLRWEAPRSRTSFVSDVAF
jgi:hypothetical protein